MSIPHTSTPPHYPPLPSPPLPSPPILPRKYLIFARNPLLIRTPCGLFLDWAWTRAMPELTYGSTTEKFTTARPQISQWTKHNALKDRWYPNIFHIADYRLTSWRIIVTYVQQRTIFSLCLRFTCCRFKKHCFKLSQGSLGEIKIKNWDGSLSSALRNT